ncbi:hypothetical protein SAMN02745121_01874 [Nannocystis exedens]|uniref:Uncharacterized protein n=2 Tax=Nannocystis exedens TaxID=54 RepID=A0A1I1VRA6_9BACT|nr:hypothetical protein NAEX_05842 [Nannocystis exedens]SFD85349.1 hypothetical protein SAMN02745121_01874 [Nannocystis exedens]
MSILALATNSCLWALCGAFLAIAAPQAQTGETAASERAAEISDERDARSDWYICTVSGASDTGRVWGRVQKLANGYCIRDVVGGEAPLDVSSCHEVATLLECMHAPTLHDLAGED